MKTFDRIMFGLLLAFAVAFIFAMGLMVGVVVSI